MVGRYRIVDFLGAGAMGEVYLAEDPQIERRLAIKTVRLAGRPQEVDDRKKRLLREARAAGRLLHPNVVTLFDAGEDQGLLFLAFELVEGTDLASRLEKGPGLSLREVLRIVRQTAEALDYAHRLGIVHRDIKPSNVLLDAAGRVKVADFGIAKVAGQSTELTIAGSVMGSPQYLSPEQIRGEELDGRSDIFSLGVLLYELLSRKRPFEGETITTLVYQILHKEPPPVSELRRIPESLEKLLRRMLAKDRDERHATAGAVASELVEIERELNDETLSAPASDLPALDATRLLPRSGSPLSGQAEVIPGSGPRTVFPPPLPQAAPPPPPLPQVALPARPTASTLPAGPPPPQPPAQTTMRTVPGQTPRQGHGLGVVLGIAAVVFLLVAASGVWFIFFREKGPEAPEAPHANIAQKQTGPATEPGPQPPEADRTPAETREPEAPPVSPPAPQPPRETAVRDVREERRPQETPPVRTAPQDRRPQVTPPAPPAPEVRPPPASTDVAPAPAPAPANIPDEPAPADREPAKTGFVPDRTIQSGLDLQFKVIPPTAFVLVDGRPIGQALEWSGGKKNRIYTLPEPGDHEIKIRSQGLREVRLLVQASDRSGVTPVFANLRAVAADTAAPSDLSTVRVREAVGFRLTPRVAASILVDGQPAGTARDYAGGIGGRWLKLPPGRHRVSVVASGYQQQDFLVEVTPGAVEARERIEVTLSSGGEE
jgi:eukaryotic-like serine/threonine-protein kinase